MKTTIFDGRKVAEERHVVVQQKVQKHHKSIILASIFFTEDEGSILYTNLKSKAAIKAGMKFQDYGFSIAESEFFAVQDRIKKLAQDTTITGIIIQKPTKNIWEKSYQGQKNFKQWWTALTELLPDTKDIDCLTEANLEKLQQNKTSLMPATVKGIMVILKMALEDVDSVKHVSVIGCSDIVGRPVADVLEVEGYSVTRHCGQTDRKALKQADIVISATGRPKSITGEMIKEGSIVIDVGAPHGDIDFDSVINHATFITPVPGGVGPLTVVSLLENALMLVEQQAYVTRQT